MSRTHSFTHENTIEMLLCGSYMNFDVRVTYDFTPATPASGFYGRPENFDPGCGCEVDVTAISLRAEGTETWFTPEPWLLNAVQENAGLLDHLEEDGAERAAEAAIEAADMRAEMAREDRHHDAAE